MPRSDRVAGHQEVIETILEAYRGREVGPTGGFSLSQQNGYSCSQMLSQSHSSRVWITPSCRDVIEKIPPSELHMLIREVCSHLFRVDDLAVKSNPFKFRIAWNN
jgi:hypothetical protein